MEAGLKPYRWREVFFFLFCNFIILKDISGITQGVMGMTCLLYYMVEGDLWLVDVIETSPTI